MAGTGCLESMRVLRELRYRVDDVAFGSHLALGTAVGMLFLAGGAASVCRDAVSAACLVLAFIPRYPHRTIDNQFHLQPLRHLSALAVEKRLLRTIGIIFFSLHAIW
jgi:anaphase-promoting complex subunit 1